MLSILVVNWNTRDLLRNCLHTVLGAAEGIDVEIVVVDNASWDGTVEMLRREFAAEPRVRVVVNERNELFARGNNQAYALARGDVLLILNPDVTMRRTALVAMLGHLLSHPRAGIVSCNLVGENGALQAMHRAFPTLPVVFSEWTRWGRKIDRSLLMGRLGRHYHMTPVRTRGTSVIDQAAAACLLIRRDTVERIGGLFDERFPLFFNDVDLSRRVRDAGLEVHVLHDHAVRHEGGASIRQVPHSERRIDLLDSLTRYYEVHEAAWKARLVRRMVSHAKKRMAERSGLVLPADDAGNRAVVRNP